MARQRNELDKIYNTARWKRVRKVVLIRDGYLCCECRRRGLITEANTVHHIIALRDDPSRAFDLDNLETICLECHNREHPERSGGEKKKKRNENVFKFYGNNEII
ncbi:endonuclease [Bacillus amyloliquefaciens]|uniref:HNH endonuclease n=1 Tax=Bacillus amyloliquefaciens TaxID=1390 RepID=UPI00059BE9C6|nr:HNH endonuclease signature motif containing protein [Bacillus amyloliquefaciens]AZV88280.1 endonuclease [Bacillus amyloliquefaciens]MDR4378212.1 HNH endonuclease [Bacillus amyloliquefaciens]MEC1840206.1 HNH endonuclease signature motif containing protein [Bacillus amyloliquefaciens]MEC1848172.1 HNH endonuclease signature motif containing protein [Bacillus amyloliquefaciens]MEC1928089.1 HNH endonuclease signature motif containing protein [Bacillus amyloliquefaciens]